MKKVLVIILLVACAGGAWWLAGSRLAVSSAVPTPVVAEDGSIVVRDMMKVTLSVDHRIVDGSEGAKFVNAVKAKLQDKELWDTLI